jgi:hypothetical protein
MQGFRSFNAEWHAIYPTGPGAEASRFEDHGLSCTAAPIPALKNSETTPHAERGGVVSGKSLAPNFSAAAEPEYWR